MSCSVHLADVNMRVLIDSNADMGVVSLEYFELFIINLARWFEDSNQLAFRGMLRL